MSISFHNPWLLAAVALALLPLLQHSVRRHPYPALALFPADWPSRVLQVGLRLAAAASVALLAVAAAGPYSEGGTATRTGQGAQIVMVFDRSGSMSETLAGSFEDDTSGESKIAASRRLLLDFLAQRRGDMFGMVAFGSSAMAVAPLGEDRQMAEAALSSAEARSFGFTAVGRALEQALNYFKDRPFTAARVILLVSDGGSELSERDREVLQALFLERRVSLVWIYTRGAREPSVIDASDVGASGQSQSLHDVFLGLGVPYRVFEATNSDEVKAAVTEIGSLTNLPTRYEEPLPRRDLAPPLYTAALLLLISLACAKLYELRDWNS